MLYPYTEVRFINKQKEYGVVATRFIPKGTITWVKDELDRVFTPMETGSFKPEIREIIDLYSYRNSEGNFVFCWDNCRYMNHSFKANCLNTVFNFEIAVKDILPGEEMTNDYGFYNIEKPFRGMEEGTKRKYVYTDDLKKYYKTWDKILKDTFKKIRRVNQPLRGFIHDDVWTQVQKVIDGESEMKSILSLFFDENI